MNVHILEMPLDFGASRHGSDMGPSAIRLAGIKEKLESLGHKTFEHTDIFKASSQEYEEAGNPKAKYLIPITNACTKLAAEVEAITAKGDFPLVLELNMLNDKSLFVFIFLSFILFFSLTVFHQDLDLVFPQSIYFWGLLFVLQNISLSVD